MAIDLPRLPDYIKPIGDPYLVAMAKPGPRSDGDPLMVPHRIGEWHGERWVLRVNPDGDAWMTVRRIERVEGEDDD